MSKRITEFSTMEVLFFDFDGVIVDSVDIKAKAFAQLFKRYGNEVVEKVIEYHLSHGGISRYDKFKYYYENLLGKNITNDEIGNLDREFSKIVYDEVLKAPFIEGVLDFLNICDKKRKVMFVISATPKKEIERIVKAKKIDRYFRDVVGSPPTKDENLTYLIRQYDINPIKAVYFGDSPNDLEVAQKHLISFIPINYFDGSWGFKNFKEFMLEMGIK